MVHRLRTAAVLGSCLWPAFAVLDFLIAWNDSALLFSLLSFRLFGSVISIASWLSLRNASPDLPRVWLSRVAIYPVVCVLLALMSARIDGIAGTYAPGVMLAIMLRATSVAESWRGSTPIYLLMWLAFPLTMFAIAPFDARVAAQLQDPAALADFALHNFFCLSAATSGIVGSDAMWRLRREAYEARQLGRYKLKERLGRGAMGEVWVAYHIGLKQDVAVKVLRTLASGEVEAVARFEREVLAITRLSHPNTVRILDHGVTPEGIWFYAMELLQGCDLRTLIEREGALPPRRALALARQACLALAEAHRQGVVHRDVKPSNLFVAEIADEPDFVKVLDFGLAKLTQESEHPLLTHDGAVLGTPRYMAPETLDGVISSRADVYSLGCVLYEMLAGRPPFEEAGLATLMRQHRDVIPPPPSTKLGAPLPAELEAIVMRCLEKDPERRHAHAGELAEVLSEQLERLRGAPASEA